MNHAMSEAYLAILTEELRPAMGCTEPIALAYAGATVREVLAADPLSLDIYLSGNMIKNAKAVSIPNSQGLKGIEAAVLLGFVGGDSEAKLEVIANLTEDDIITTKALLEAGICSTHLAEDVPLLYIKVVAKSAESEAVVVIEHAHTAITRITKDGKHLFLADSIPTEETEEDKSDTLFSVENIIAFANQVAIEKVKPLLDRQILYNESISNEGFSGNWGAMVGRSLVQNYDASDVRIRARAKAAAGSDARMGGCPMPVIINSGSGNQGLTVSLPVIEYARELQTTDELLYRALVLANLIAIHQKQQLGALSAFCGVVFAAAGAASGIAYLHGGGYPEISKTITNTLANIGGMLCDGAKPSCAVKISSALEAAIIGFEMGTKELRAFSEGEGLVSGELERTITNFTRVGKDGMSETDRLILSIMLE